MLALAIALLTTAGVAGEQPDVARSASRSSSVPASPPSQATGPVQGVPKGTIMAFVPNMANGDYANASQLRAWLARQGWAVCDGTGGTPDLRNRMLLGTTDASNVGQRIGAWEHSHRVRGETGIPVRRNRNTPTGRLNSQQIPDDQHRHRVDMRADKAEHLPPSMRVLFIMKVR